MKLGNYVNNDEWCLEEKGMDWKRINADETRMTVGNGYLGTRATLEEGDPAGFPGTYLNGFFDRYDATVIDMVNVPNWLPLQIRVNGAQLNCRTCTLVSHRRTLDMRHGFLYRHTLFRESNGNETEVETICFADWHYRHLCVLHCVVTPLNYDGDIEVTGGVDACVYNIDRVPDYSDRADFDPQVKWKKWARSKHLYDFTSRQCDDNLSFVMHTRDPQQSLSYALSLYSEDPHTAWSEHDYEWIGKRLHFAGQKGKSITIQKRVVIYTSRDVEAIKVQDSSEKLLTDTRTESFEQIFSRHCALWDEKWQKCDGKIVGDDELTFALRFNIYHLLIAADAQDDRNNIGAKSLSGEGYKGHIFWDTDIFLLPFFTFTQPHTARSLVMYRYHTLEGAKRYAQETGYQGARYPWESAAEGVEETPQWTHDRKVRIWTGEEEIHITADVAIGAINYYIATRDEQMFFSAGMEILLEVARFWESRLEHDAANDCYHLRKVIGPDEFHEHVDNNYFTNRIVMFCLEKIVYYYREFMKRHPKQCAQLSKKLGVSEKDSDKWLAMAHKIYLPSSNEAGVIEEFEGYFQLEDVQISEWDERGLPIYPRNLDHYTCNPTQLVKQPDVIMLMMILSDQFSEESKRVNYQFYEKRTMHKSSLSPAIHTIMGIATGLHDKAMEYFRVAALVDLHDNQKNTQDGVHIASAGGTWQAFVCGFGGMRVMDEELHFHPWLPDTWEEIHFSIQWRGDTLRVKIGHHKVYIVQETDHGEHSITIGDQVYSLTHQHSLEVQYAP